MGIKHSEQHDDNVEIDSRTNDEIAATPGAVELKATVAATRAAKRKYRWWITAILTVLFLAIAGSLCLTAYTLWVPHPGELGQQKIDVDDYIGTWKLNEVRYFGSMAETEPLTPQDLSEYEAMGITLDTWEINADGSCIYTGESGESYTGTWSVSIIHDGYLNSLKRLPRLLKGDRSAKTKTGIVAHTERTKPKRTESDWFVFKKGKLIKFSDAPPGYNAKLYFVRSE